MPHGALVVQAPSREALPVTFAAVRATLSSAGLAVSSYEAPVPLLGAVSFLVGSHAPLPEVEARTLPRGLRYLDPAALRRATSAAEPPSVSAEVSTLEHQRAVVTWHLEQAKLGN
jgi:predicted membrane-bound spermidine synthase